MWDKNPCLIMQVGFTLLGVSGYLDPTSIWSTDRMFSLRSVIILSLLPVLLLFAGCNTIELQPSISMEDLLKRPRQITSAPPQMEYDLLYVDEEMRAFVEKIIAGTRSTDARLRRLLRGMSRRGLANLNYNLDLTYTAQNTFHRLEGNCLSFTNLFVALAREAGLRVHYQMVEVPPKWDAGEGGLVILNNHVNVIVEQRFNTDYLVDFNLFEYQDNYRSKVVSDDYAESMFYSNLAVEALQNGLYGDSFWYLHRALNLYSPIASSWINLGVLYSRLDQPLKAESAYLHALQLDQGNKSALANLASLYTLMGDAPRAEVYVNMVNYYRERNPYYHFSLASRAFENGQFEVALGYLERSLRLKQVEHQFHYLKSLTYSELGNVEQARKSLERAYRYAVYQETRSKYSAELAAFST